MNRLKRLICDRIPKNYLKGTSYETQNSSDSSRISHGGERIRGRPRRPQTEPARPGRSGRNPRDHRRRRKGDQGEGRRIHRDRDGQQRHGREHLDLDRNARPERLRAGSAGKHESRSETPDLGRDRRQGVFPLPREGRRNRRGQARLHPSVGRQRHAPAALQREDRRGEGRRRKDRGAGDEGQRRIRDREGRRHRAGQAQIQPHDRVFLGGDQG